jgi:hypothetical protein
MVIVGALFVGLLALLFNIRIKGFILDEAVIKQSAVHYTQGLPYNLFHDINARATSRLYSLLISPLFALFHGDVGVRMARGLNGLLFASTAIPAYLLARQVLVSRRLAALTGLAAITLPWLTLTTAMFTENLAYPLVMWTVCAMAWSFRAPSLWRDLLVVALIGAATATRTQLFALAFGYLALIVWRLLLDRPRGGRARAQWARASARAFPVTAAAAVLGVLAVLVLLQRGRLDYHLHSVLGGYAQTTSDRKTIPVDVGTGLVVEILALSLGVGVIPMLLTAAWWPRAVTGALGDGARGVAAAMGCAVIALFAFTIYSQGGFQGPITEERYYFYAAPLLWIGAFAAVESRCVQRRELLEAGLGLAVVAAVLPLPRTFDIESSYFAPAMTSTNYVIDKVRIFVTDVTGRPGLSRGDALAVILTLMVLGLWYIWRRTSRAALFGLGAAVAVQLLLLFVAFMAIDGRLPGVPGRTSGPPFAQLGFIDRGTDDGQVTWIDNQPRSDEFAANKIQRTAVVYNDGIRQRIALPALAITPDDFPLNGQPLGVADVAPDGAIRITQGVLPVRLRDVVESTGSPFLQLDGRTLSHSPDELGLEVKRLAQPARAAWYVTGLSPSGALAPSKPARLHMWGNRTARLTLVAPNAPARVTLRFGGRSQVVRIPRGAMRPITLSACGDGRGTLEAAAPLTVARVDLAPAAC